MQVPDVHWLVLLRLMGCLGVQHKPSALEF